MSEKNTIEGTTISYNGAMQITSHNNHDALLALHFTRSGGVIAVINTKEGEIEARKLSVKEG